MTKNVFRIDLLDHNPKTGQRQFMLIEVEDIDVIELSRRLNKGDVVPGSRLRTKKTSEEGVFEVVERRPVALTHNMVAKIETPRFRYVEAE